MFASSAGNLVPKDRNGPAYYDVFRRDLVSAETVLVSAPHGDYVFSIMTNNIKDQRWVPDNETSVLIRKISALLWHYYEPKSKWKPAAGMGKLMKNE